MSDDGTGFQDVSEEEGAEASSPAAAPASAAGGGVKRPASPAVSEESVDSVDSWVTELLARLSAGDKLNASDSARVPYATQLQQQYFVAVQQQKSESAASQLARDAAKGRPRPSIRSSSLCARSQHGKGYISAKSLTRQILDTQPNP